MYYSPMHSTIDASFTQMVMLEIAEGSLDRAAFDKIGLSVDRSLERVRSRMDEEEVARVRLRLFREAVRRQCDLPVLSLFEDGF